MKVSRGRQPFVPLSIEVETSEDYEALRDILRAVSPTTPHQRLALKLLSDLVTTEGVLKAWN